ncbi:nicotinamide mononucleotide deamidase-related protein YfaY [Enterobacteriaceae bacterium YMB-R22]|uniref:nicotinamide mononucleotide deamidase-related protein YfaY n=1 Tax=Tenebrionicola larvae TaxID=2815733 RepID=UPI002010E1E4|nr:nicotinamide mononucleotide deamidase-related protein YfaY [Tenebrionicola larvae]MBV4411932.1 nicotinamide mononucleotide deamidase-related protein YfaY [Tenebrionicola larvae]
MINVEMLSTGDEVLHGQIVDTNAAWLADYLFSQGLAMCRRSTVGDALASLVAALHERSRHADVLIVNGGLGPTRDDLSAQAAALALGQPLVENGEWLARMTRYFAERGGTMAPSNRKQALLPAGSEMLDNPVGTACGFVIGLNGCLIFFTPGVPSEFKVMVEQQILPRLRERFSLPEPPLCLRLTTFGRGESDLAQRLDALALPADVVLGYRASAPVIELKLTGPAAQRDAMMPVWQAIKREVGDSLLFEGTQGLAAAVAQRLAMRGASLAVSEQFCNGLLSWELCDGGVALARSEVLPAEAETLAQCMQYAACYAAQTSADIVLRVVAAPDESFNFALVSAGRGQGVRVRFGFSNRARRIQQDTCVVMALSLLHRWLDDEPLDNQYGWVRILEHVAMG